MAVNKEYRCIAHDLEFESTEDSPSCPSGCHPKFVVREFRTAFSIGTNGAKQIDGLQRQLAADYGLTNMRNDRGQSVMELTDRRSGGRREVQSQAHAGTISPEQRATWAPSIFKPNQGWAKTGEVPRFDFNQSGLKGPGGVAATKPQLDIARRTLRSGTVVEKRWNG